MTQQKPLNVVTHDTKGVGDRSFFDVFTDVLTPPEDIQLHRADWGYEARVRDAKRIRQDIENAVRSLEQGVN